MGWSSFGYMFGLYDNEKEAAAVMYESLATEWLLNVHGEKNLEL